MPKVIYTVAATFPDEATADEFIAWITGPEGEGGHAAAVIRGGAESAAVVRLDTGPGQPPQVEIHYTFPGREAFDRYVRDFAPALRAEGQRLFGPDRGILYGRRQGIVAWTSVFVRQTGGI